MSRKINLPDEFYHHDFESLMKREPHTRTRIRFMGMRHIQQGRSCQYVADSLFKSVSTVKRWVSRYRKQGIDGLREGQRSGRKCKDFACDADLSEFILRMQDNKAGGRIRLKDIRQKLFDDFGIEYRGDSGVHYLLERLGFSWITSRSKHPKASAENIRLYKKLPSNRNRRSSC